MAQFITILHGGRGSAETPKLYYVIYEQPLTVSLTVKRPFFKTPLKTAVQNNASTYSLAVFFLLQHTCLQTLTRPPMLNDTPL